MGFSLFGACEDSGDDETPGDFTSPGQITDLAITGAGDGSLTLEWTAPGDNGYEGTATSYRLRWSDAPITGANFSAANTVAGVPAPAPAGTVETFTVTGLDTMLTYHFAVRAVDEADNAGIVSNNAVWSPTAPPQHFVKDIPAFQDNSMFSEADTLSNGAGQHLFAGRTAAGDLRRALLAFAISDSLPAAAVIDSVRLTLNVSKSLAGTRTVTLHRVGAAWGEGSSDAEFEEGFRFFDTLRWTTSGGDYSLTASATNAVGTNGPEAWSSAAMAADVQGWLDAPATNFGWVVVGAEGTNGTAKRFDSREHPTTANRPRLTVYYTVP
jgi:hypothetical protein